MKYYGEGSKQNFINLIYETEIDIEYKDSGYTFWLDGNGYCVGMTFLNNKRVSSEEHENSVIFADTVEELIDKFVLYDGTRFADVLEMDVESYATMKPVKK